MDKTQLYLEHIEKLLSSRIIPELQGEDAKNPLLKKIHDDIKAIRETCTAFSAGNFDGAITTRGVIPGCLKSIQANLRHLSWQIQEIGKGDYSQRINFMGEFSTCFNQMILRLKRSFDKETQLAKMSLMVKATGIGMWDIEVNYDDPANPQLTYNISDMIRQILGYEGLHDFPNEMNTVIECFHPEDRERIRAAFIDHFNDKKGLTPYDIEYRMRKKNGEYITVRDSAETIRDDAGNPVHISGALQDITPVKNLIAEADKQREEAIAANLAKSAFLSTISHELRTPLNAILGITDILMYKGNLPDDVNNSLGMIHTSGDLLLGIINDILDLSKIEAGKLELTNGLYELASLISDTLQLNWMRIGNKAIELKVCVDENLPSHLIGDQLRIKQILNNLLSNAIKYTNAGTVKLVVGAASGHDAGKPVLSLAVSDTGHGMTKEQLDILFEKYSRFNQDANSNIEGTGLGLPITQNLVQLMGGEISVKSEPGKGSVFTVRLPQAGCGAGNIGKETVETLKRFHVFNRRRLKRVQITREPMPYGKVLIVDDVESNIYVASGLLAPYELNIDSANSGKEAIEKIKAGYVYDIIFMDFMMPELDGIQTTRQIRDLGYTNSIVALTANVFSSQENGYYRNGFDAFITKPIDIRQLNMVLNKLVRDKHPQAAAEFAKHRAERTVDIEDGRKRYIEIDPMLTEVFLIDANKFLAAMDDLLKQGLTPDSEELGLFNVHVHGMKSALSNINQMSLSAAALRLESLSREGNVKAVNSEAPVFLADLRAFISEITKTKTRAAEMPYEEKEDTGFLGEQLEIIRLACDEYDDLTIEDALKKLKTKIWHADTNKLLDDISSQLLLSGFDEIRSLVSKFLD